MIIKGMFSGTIFDVSKRQNAVFWAGQLAVIFSTILGVYLAASAGLKTALNFHSLISHEKNFYTLSALRSEVDNNNQLLIDFTQNQFVFNENNEMVAHKSARPPALNWFVWLTMSNATETLELPVDILKDTNRYYLELTKEITNYEKRGGMDKLFAAKRLHKLSRETQKTLIARMDQHIKIYQSRFAAHENLGEY
ncbi:MAG: hypothetical protein ACRBBR_11895 [Cellvibrionaceae bacterium]